MTSPKLVGQAGTRVRQRLVVEGSVEGRAVSATWVDGELKGDYQVVLDACRLVTAGSEVVSATGGHRPASLEDARAVLDTLGAVMDEVTAVEARGEHVRDGAANRAGTASARRPLGDRPSRWS